jgi:hypothetical protein
VAGQRFYLKPLLEYLSGDSYVYVLELSLDSVRLLEGDRSGLREISCDGLPESLDAATAADDGERVLQAHTHGHGGQSAVFHGQEEGSAPERLLQYFRACDAAVSRRLRDQSAPLMLACVDRHAAIYRQVNSYPHLAETVLSGSPHGIGRERLAAELRGALDHLKIEREQAAAERYRAGKAAGKASAKLSEVMDAAAQGRVASVFVPAGAELLGRGRPANADFDGSAEQARDLLDLLVAETYLNGGDVLAVAADQMPDHGVVAGVFRY